MQVVVQDYKFILARSGTLQQVNQVALFESVYSDTCKRQLAGVKIDHLDFASETHSTG
jgi:hypothetical protein